MKNSDIFDVLIVYTSTIAISASNKNTTNPFPKTSKYVECNDSYGYFIDLCKKNKINVAFTTSADVIGAGKAKSYWIYENKKWIPVKRNCYAQQIFEKFQPVNSFQQHKRELLFSASHIRPFVNTYLFDVFADKQLTYDTLSQYSIPTITISDTSSTGIQHSLDELNELLDTHPNKNDFLPFLIMKDRLGSSGSNIFRITSNFQEEIEKIIKKNNNISFIIQPFVKFDNGFEYKNRKGFIEVRLLHYGKKVIQTYIRIAPKNTFICNETEGSVPISKNEVPQHMYRVAKKIVKTLGKDNNIFALDFIMSNNGNIYLLEANSSPGIDWYSQVPGNIEMNKKTIKIMVKELYKKVHNRSYLDTPVQNYSPYSLTPLDIQK